MTATANLIKEGVSSISESMTRDDIFIRDYTDPDSESAILRDPKLKVSDKIAAIISEVNPYEEKTFVIEDTGDLIDKDTQETKSKEHGPVGKHRRMLECEIQFLMKYASFSADAEGISE